ncbi:MAG: hypothetical protein ACXAEX_14960 [Promethearchaeota archaeon]|jgi:hypothetical protein
MKKGPVCYLYYTIKNKRKEKADNSDLHHYNPQEELTQQKEFIDS